MAIIFANKLYSNKEIIALFPLLENVPPALLSFFFVILLFVLYYAFLFVKELFAEMSEPSISNEQAIPTSHPTTEDGVHVTATPATEIQTTAQPIRKHTNILRTLLMALASVAIIALTFISYEWLKVGSEEIITTDIVEFASTILTNGAIILIAIPLKLVTAIARNITRSMIMLVANLFFIVVCIFVTTKVWGIFR